MHEVYNNLWVGGDKDFEKVKDKSGFSFLRCCKYGDCGHKDLAGYDSRGAPKGPDYLSIRKGNILALNLIDAPDPNFIPIEVIKIGLKFIKERLEAGDKVGVFCNAGYSRGPSTAMAYLHSIGDLPYNFHKSESVFIVLYPPYSPNQGIRTVIKQNWHLLNNLET